MPLLPVNPVTAVGCNLENPAGEGLGTAQIIQMLQGGQIGFLHGVHGPVRVVGEPQGQGIHTLAGLPVQFLRCLPVPLLGQADRFRQFHVILSFFRFYCSRRRRP